MRNGRRTGNSIPQLETTVRKSHRFRFNASSPLDDVAITTFQVLGAAGGICSVVNNSVSYINRSMKIKSIEIWSPTSTSTTSATCSVNWQGGTNAPNVEVSDTSINQSRPAHIMTRPPVNSLASFWAIGGGTTVFKISCPGGSIIDIQLSLIEVDQSAASNTATITTGTLGALYYLALDGPTTNLLVPISLNTTS
jgi:hypothetical protein